MSSALALTPVYSVVWLLAFGLAACVILLIRLRQSVRRVNDEQQRQVHALVSRSNELEATLQSMVEGVLAVSLEGRILSLNDAATALLGGYAEAFRGGRVQDVIAHDALALFIQESLAATEPLQEELTFGVGAETRQYMAQGAVLRDRVGARLGSLIVLHDITVLRQLEVVRRDFVSNASHEIKTPVAAIQAAAETLDDAGDDPEVRAKFLPMIVRQTGRLTALVEDLLSLARIERDTEDMSEAMTSWNVLGLLKRAAEWCEVKAERREVKVHLDCDDALVAVVNGPLIEQAVINLVDNAIKYSPQGAQVRVGAARVGGEVVISVSDTGPGIAQEHQSRLFERFYRTDKARSRELGGTGLGLAIVKHIAVGHHGNVTIKSREGEGSTFRLHLPLG